MDVKAISMCNANKELMSLVLIADALRVIDIVLSIENSRSRYYSDRKLIKINKLKTCNAHKIELNRTCNFSHICHFEIFFDSIFYSIFCKYHFNRV